MSFEDIIDTLCDLKEECKGKNYVELYSIFENIELEFSKLAKENISLMEENNKLKLEVLELRSEISWAKYPDMMGK